MLLTPLLVLLQENTTTQGATGAPPPGTTPPAASPWSSFSTMLLPMVLVFVIFYFLMIRPESKARKARQAMLAAVKKGDRVMTNSGMFAKVAAINNDEIILEIADGVRAKFSRAAVQSVLGEESLKEEKA